MKKAVSLSISFILILSIAVIPAYARDLEICSLCGGDDSYRYTCPDCHNEGTYACSVCGGDGTVNCTACSGNGTVTCSTCNGNGTIGDPAEQCPDCSGLGTVECSVCHGANTLDCATCGGDGVIDCTSQYCVSARNNGGKCPKCQGKGYVLSGSDGPGVIPQKGDRIKIGDTITVFGETSTTTTKKAEDKTTEKSDDNDTTKAEEKSDDKKEETIDEETTTAKANDNDNNEVETTTAKEEKTKKNKVAKIGETDVHFDPIELPKDRKTVIYLGLDQKSGEDGDEGEKTGTENYTGIAAFGVVDYHSMIAKQREVYDNLSDEDLAQILGNVQGIIKSVTLGSVSEESEESLDKFLENNNLSGLSEGNILPVRFEGHINIGFPVRISVEMDPGQFDGKSPVYVYHIDAEGKISKLDSTAVTCIRNENGEVIRVEFLIQSFSDFFMTDTDGLVIPSAYYSDGTSDSARTRTALQLSDSDRKFIWIAFFSAIGLALITGLVIIIVKHKHKSELEDGVFLIVHEDEDDEVVNKEIDYYKRKYIDEEVEKAREEYYHRKD